MSLSCDIAPRSQIETYWRCRSAYCLHHQGPITETVYIWNVGQFLRDYTALYHRRQLTGPDDGGNKQLWNVGKLLPDYMNQYTTRQSGDPDDGGSKQLWKSVNSTRLHGSISQETVVFIRNITDTTSNKKLWEELIHLLSLYK
jgi:hypothetical protein